MCKSDTRTLDFTACYATTICFQPCHIRRRHRHRSPVRSRARNSHVSFKLSLLLLPVTTYLLPHQGTQICGVQRYTYQNYTELFGYSSQSSDIHLFSFTQKYLIIKHYNSYVYIKIYMRLKDYLNCGLWSSKSGSMVEGSTLHESIGCHNCLNKFCHRVHVFCDAFFASHQCINVFESSFIVLTSIC
jgi:hypothetical protein